MLMLLLSSGRTKSSQKISVFEIIVYFSQQMQRKTESLSFSVKTSSSPIAERSALQGGSVLAKSGRKYFLDSIGLSSTTDVMG